MTEQRTVRFGVYKLTVFLFAFYALKTAWLAFDRLEYSPVFYYFGEFLVVLCLPCALLVLLHMRRIKIPANRALLFLPFIICLYTLIHPSGETDYLRDTYTLLVILAFIFFPPRLKVRIYQVLYQLVLITGTISIVLYVLYALGINIGFKEVPYYSVLSTSRYVKWAIFAIYKSGSILRLCGIFNEPGGFGTICSLLFIAGFRHMERWEKFVLLVSVGLSFSLAGYLLIFGFALVYLAFRDARYVLFIIPLLLLFFAIPYIDFGNETLNRFAARLAITAQGLAGDNRTKRAFDLLYDSFLHGNKLRLLFGYGANYSDWTGVLSYKTFVVQFGLLGFGFWIAVWLKAGLGQAKRDKDCLIFLLFFILSLYQRPMLLTSIYGYVLLFGGMEWIHARKNVPEAGLRNES